MTLFLQQNLEHDDDEQAACMRHAKIGKEDLQD